MNDILYFILIVIFTLIVFLLYNPNLDDDRNNNISKDNFNNTDEKVDISGYIKSTINDFEDKKNFINAMSNKPIIKDDPKYKYGLENHNLGQDMQLFNNQMDMLMDTTLSSCSKIKSNIETNIKNIEENENRLNVDYVKQFHKNYKEQQSKIGMVTIDKEFSRFYDNDEIDNHATLEGFEINKATTIKNESNISLFMGNFLILPFQYKHCNHVYINLIDNNPSVKYNPNKIYLMSFYLLDNKFLELETTIAFKNKTLYDEENDLIEPTNVDLISNIKGIILTLKQKNSKFSHNYRYINTINNIKNILKQLGIIPGNQLMLFLVDSKFESKTNCKIKELKCEATSSDLYRLYSMNGTSLLHLSKNTIIDKPFSSLLK